MIDSDSLHKLIDDLKERAKELNCIYEVREILNNTDESIENICGGIVKAIPHGWQYPDICKARISLFGEIYQSDDFVETEWIQCAIIKVDDSVVGKLCVIYSEERPLIDEGPFLKDERKLIENISQQIGMFLLHQKIKTVFENHQDKGIDPHRTTRIPDLYAPPFAIHLLRLLWQLCWPPLPGSICR